MSLDDRSWMDNRRNNRVGITDEFRRGVKYFISFCKEHPNYMRGENIRCPCAKCSNRKYESPGIVEKHLYQNGFIPGYKRWIAQGEKVIVQRPSRVPIPTPEPEPENDGDEVPDDDQGIEDMVRDVAGQDHDWSNNHVEEPNNVAKKFIDMMESAKEPVYNGSHRTVLEATARFLKLKSNHNMSQSNYSDMMAIVKDLLPKDNKLVGSFYETKKLVGKIGLSYEKIDACKNDCIIFYKEHENATHCPTCGLSRYKPPKTGGSSKRKTNVARKQLRYMPLIPRLQRLFTSKATSKAMRWHKESPREEGVLVHPSDGEAWKQFDATYPDFADDVRNVRLGICSDGFNPYGPGAKAYSCWPVIVTVYNLPPWMCMNDPYLFCTLFIPGPKSPGKNIDVYLRPLIDELKLLWTDGVHTWDGFKKENFNLRAAVMWTINDFPAYGMLSGWSTHGKLACPYCMNDTKSFTLTHSKKPCWFDCHRRFLPKDHSFRKQKYAFTKNREDHDEPPPRRSGEDIYRELSEKPDCMWGKKYAKFQLPGYGTEHKWTKMSIFWELPYWKTNLIRHNLDVMHIEKNVFDNIFNTVMDFKGTSKDTINGRKDLKEICKRPELELKEVDGKTNKPVAEYVLTKNQKVLVLNWLKNLRLPDGYASNIGNCVNIEEGKMQGLKSHDCHVLLDRLLPIALRDLLPDKIWVALTELSEFFRALTSSTLRVADMKKMEETIVVTLCKLEKIFPPSFFDSMEHLVIHLAYEARVGGPVQYRWMYPFERFLGALKRKMSNRARVEASISEAVVIDEIVSFVSAYLPSNIETILPSVGRNYDGGDPESNGRLSVFSQAGRFLGKSIGRRMLSLKELDAAKLFVLINCPEVEVYLSTFEAEAGNDVSPEVLQIRTDNEFIPWLKKYISEHPEDANAQKLKPLTSDPYLDVDLYNGYFVGGYVFHTSEYGESKSTWNSGVNLKGNLEYYGVLQEVIELRYFGGNNVVLFNCSWRDALGGIRKHPEFDMVDVLSSSKHEGDDVFILATQAQQVYMTPYPYRRANSVGWWAVWKTKARSVIDIPYEYTPTTTESSLEGCYQEDEMPHYANVSSDEHLEGAHVHHSHPQFEEVIEDDEPEEAFDNDESEMETDNEAEDDVDEECNDTDADDEIDLEFDDLSL